MTTTDKAIAAAAVLAGLAVTAAPASAGHELVTCRFAAANQNEFGAPDRYLGVAEGHIVDIGAVSVQCLVKVDGVVRAATTVGTGTNHATTADPVMYVRTPDEVVSLCAAYTTPHVATERCVIAYSTAVARDAQSLSHAEISVAP